MGQIFPAFPTVSHSGQFAHFSHTFVNDSGRHLDDFNVFGITIDRLHVLPVMRVQSARIVSIFLWVAGLIVVLPFMFLSLSALPMKRIGAPPNAPDQRTRANAGQHADARWADKLPSAAVCVFGIISSSRFVATRWENW